MAKKRHSPRQTQPDRLLTAVVADTGGHIFELPGYAAVGLQGELATPLTRAHTQPLPFGGELMYLPDRQPMVYNQKTDRIQVLSENPYEAGEAIFPVAAFNSPGYVTTRISAYCERPGAGPLPLFSYGAVGWQAAGFRSAVVRVDREPRQDLRRMNPEKVKAGIRWMRKRMPDNRLRTHLETCALQWGCPAAKNFFLGRYEAPLPTARQCNARCLGCISLQQDTAIQSSQHRLSFTPTPAEIAQVAQAHIARVDRAVVSFGQGCEGDPLLAADVITPAIERVRAATQAGTINLNTNGSRPQVMRELFQAGLDSVRISLNSVQKRCYEAYFRPRGYGFEDVVASIDMGLGMGRLVSINYLNMPGFTDTPEELEALSTFLEQHPLHLIQWRNLNFDPQRYWRAMDVAAERTPVGLPAVLKHIRNRHPGVQYGYFNPPKERYRSWPLFAGKVQEP